MTRKIKMDNGTIEFKDTYEVLIEKKVTKFGTGAKVDCPKEYLGRRVYLLIR
jgi:putative transposon-encoded protein